MDTQSLITPDMIAEEVLKIAESRLEHTNGTFDILRKYVVWLEFCEADLGLSPDEFNNKFLIPKLEYLVLDKEYDIKSVIEMLKGIEIKVTLGIPGGITHGFAEKGGMKVRFLRSFDINEDKYLSRIDILTKVLKERIG